MANQEVWVKLNIKTLQQGLIKGIIMVKNILHFAAYSFFLFFLNACSFYNNQIYYDEKLKAVRICEGSLISSLEIESAYGQSERIFYIYSLTDYKLGSEYLYLFKKNEGYEISHIGQILDDSICHLPPNQKYVILNESNGDAAAGKLEIEIGPNGEVIHASKTKCK
ncbi:MAG TPA: hypothetical protein VII99_07825 [Bacteroidia bacterium]